MSFTKPPATTQFPPQDQNRNQPQLQDKSHKNNKRAKETPQYPPYRQIRALHTPTTITVYQAYRPSIASAAIATQSFTQVPDFKRFRMTWIKPSFLWMAYRSGYARKNGQERVLAIEIWRTGFEWALQHACLSHEPLDATEQEVKVWKGRMEKMPVRVQWDPERDLWGRPLAWRSLQVGLKGEAVERYIAEWIVGIQDVTGLMRAVGDRVEGGDVEGAMRLLPGEGTFELEGGVGRGIGIYVQNKAVG